jgi:hypothetical protein
MRRLSTATHWPQVPRITKLARRGGHSYAADGVDSLVTGNPAIRATTIRTASACHSRDAAHLVGNPFVVGD